MAPFRMRSYWDHVGVDLLISYVLRTSALTLRSAPCLLGKTRHQAVVCADDIGGWDGILRDPQPR